MRVKLSACVAASIALAIMMLAAPAPAAQANNKPCLCQAEITPMSGKARTVFVATVWYRDPDGDAPTRVEVYIDGTAYPMRLSKGRPADGTYRARLTLPPGEHNHYFYALDNRGMDERLPRYGARPGPFVGTKTAPNRLPMLSEGGVYSDIGGDKQVYTFTVYYKDPDGEKQPRVVKVMVDGVPHEMKLHKGVKNDGIYAWSGTLPAGPHAFYFMAIDEVGDCVMFPRYGFLRGPEVVASGNRPPDLLDGSIWPAAGGKCSRFTYSVTYRDADDDPPAVAMVYTNGIPHKMNFAGGKRYSGRYTYSARHPIGNMHDYYFYFEDHRGGTVRIPPRGIFHGPVVTR